MQSDGKVMLIKIARHTHCYHFAITFPSFCLQNEEVKKVSNVKQMTMCGPT